MQNPAVDRVSTSCVDPADRIAFWEEFNAHTLFGLRCSTLEPELTLDAVRTQVDGVRVRSVSGTPHLIERTGAALDHSPTEALYVSILERGRGFFHSPAGTHLLSAGQAVVYRTRDPHLFGFETDLSLRILEVDATRLEPGPGAAAGTEPDGGPSVLAPAATATLRGALRSLDAGAAPAAGTVIDLLRASLNPAAASSSAHFARATRLLGEHLADPGLSPEFLAALAGVSPRQLHRVFAREGTSPAREIQRRRLDAAREDLLRDDRESVTSVAARWGFASPAHFSRAFKREFGHAPRETRGA